jgi:hypothetical protein
MQIAFALKASVKASWRSTFRAGFGCVRRQAGLARIFNIGNLSHRQFIYMVTLQFFT